MKCRFCQEKLEHLWLDLGHAPPSNGFLSQQQLELPEVYHPLKLMVCKKCLLVQAPEVIAADKIFDSNYAYFSSYSSTWLAHAKLYCEQISKRLELNRHSLVVEVAANDGYLLRNFVGAGIPCVGVEPAAGVARVAQQQGIEMVTQFFNVTTARQLAARKGKADLVIANNVLAHVPDINGFVEGFTEILKPGGTVSFEFPHLMKLVQGDQFDTVYHEHYFYFSAHVVRRILGAHGLFVYDIQQLPTHGGSLRVFARHHRDNEDAFTKRMRLVLDSEVEIGLIRLNFYQGFQEVAERARQQLLRFLLDQREKGKTVVGYGAAAKGNTLLNYSGIKRDLLPYVVDASPHKVGKFLPGSHIPVVGEEMLRQTRPDVVLILPWNLSDEIQQQLAYIRNWGGRFAVAIPEIRLL